MLNKKINVLYVCHDRVQLAGAVYSMINMIESIDKVVNPYILVRNGKVCDELRKRGFQCISFPYRLDIVNKKNKEYSLYLLVRRLVSSILNYICLLYVKIKLNRVKLDIVHTNSTATQIGYKLSRIFNAKHVWHIREFLDLDFGMKPVAGWNNLYKKIYDSDLVIAITKDVYKHWSLQESRKAKVLFNAVRSISDIDVNTNKEKCLLFCSATLSDNKGADFAMELFCKSNLSSEGYRLKMIGVCDDNYLRKLKSIANAYNQLSNVDFLGYQNNVKEYIKEASVLLMCSVCEAMGRVTVEALFYGCPVLGHNTGGTKEIIQDGTNGFLYDDMTDALTKLNIIIHNKNISETFINNGVIDAREKFSKENYGKKILELYDEVLID